MDGWSRRDSNWKGLNPYPETAHPGPPFGSPTCVDGWVFQEVRGNGMDRHQRRDGRGRGLSPGLQILRTDPDRNDAEVSAIEGAIFWFLNNRNAGGSRGPLRLDECHRKSGPHGSRTRPRARGPHPEMGDGPESSHQEEDGRPGLGKRTRRHPWQRAGRPTRW
jgi:hypothetical protein